MKDKVFLLWVSVILLIAYASAQAAGQDAPLGCPSPKLGLSVANSGSLAYNEANTLQMLVKNTGNTDATIKRLSANIETTFVSCASYVVKPGEQKECQITLTPKPEQGLSLQVDYEYNSCGRTRTGQAQIQVLTSQTLSLSASAQVYAINVHGGCENSYYACSAPDKSGMYSAGYECYDKDNTYYSPAKERIDLRFDLPVLSSKAVSVASLKLYVSAANNAQEVALYSMTGSWNPVTCSAGGDICTQPYCAECQTLFDSSGDIIASQTISSGGEISFDVTDAVNKAYSSGKKSLSLQLRGAEDLWDAAGAASCDKPYAWSQQGIEFYGGANQPYIVLNNLVKETSPGGTAYGEICTDCCTNGETECSVLCNDGIKTFTGASAITNCSYDGQTVTVWRGTDTQTQNCVTGACYSGNTSNSSTTTNPVTTTSASSTSTSTASSTTNIATTTSAVTTTTQSSDTCVDGTPVGQCSTWMDGLRCVNNYGYTYLDYDPSCSSGPTPTSFPNPTTPPTSMPNPNDMCFGTPQGQCSTWLDCFRCTTDQYIGMDMLEYDETCCSGSSTTTTTITNSTTTSTITNSSTTTSSTSQTTSTAASTTTTTLTTDTCNDGTPVGQCSTSIDGIRCVDDPTTGPILEYDSTCSSSSTTSVTTTLTPTTSTTTNQTTSTAASTTTTTLSSCVPAYDPNKWNNNARALNCNNCYNYGCDKETDNFAQPGYAHGYSVSMDCSSVIQGANADGLKYLGKTDGPCTGCMHKVALVVAPGTDFHWYRQDNNGKWSHKPGSTAVRNVDESGQEITSPETANRGMYTSFCGYFCVDKNAVSIQGPNSCPY